MRHRTATRRRLAGHSHVLRNDILTFNYGSGRLPVKYYYREHLLGYERIKAEGKSARNQLHGGTRFEDFS